jgi:hypothetical protein
MISKQTDTELFDRVLLLKIQVAATAERLFAGGQGKFGSRLMTGASKLYLEMLELEKTTDVTVANKRLANIVSHINEMENILIACKYGVGLTAEENLRGKVIELRKEINDKIKRLDNNRELILNI